MAARAQHGAIKLGDQRLGERRSAQEHEVAFLDLDGVVDDDAGEFFDAGIVHGLLGYWATGPLGYWGRAGI